MAREVRTGAGFIEIADRVFLARYRQWDVGVGLVVGDDRALVVDTRASAGQGAEILGDVRRLGLGVAVTQVVNTHVHFDHTFGNTAFEGAMIHAHANVARNLPPASDRIKALIREDPQGAPEYGYTAQDLLDVLDTSLRPPDTTFATTQALDLGGRAVLLGYAGRGHTDGDIRIVVPDAAVAFLGDLVEESAPPSFGEDSWPLDWPETLGGHLRELDDAVVVPGHGRPVDTGFVARQHDEITAVATVIRERCAAGLPLKEASREPDSRLPYPLKRLESAFARGYAQLSSG